MNTRKGFTLVELLVVIAILAILATVSVVGYTSFIDRAHKSNAEALLNQVVDYVYSAEVSTAPDYAVNLADGELATYLTAMGVDSTTAAKFSNSGNTITYTYDTGKTVSATVGQ